MVKEVIRNTAVLIGGYKPILGIEFCLKTKNESDGGKAINKK
jgi:hypothetical protein